MKKVIAFIGAWWKVGVIGLGILAAIGGWHVDNAQEGDLAARLFASSYPDAMEAYGRLRRFAGMSDTDPGFAEIASVLSEMVSEPAHPIPSGSIASIKVSEVNGLTVRAGGGDYRGPTTGLVITLKDGQEVPSENLTDLRPAIRERFLRSPLDRAGELIMLIGLGAAIVTALPEEFKAARANWT